jgi:DNA-binding XRE family transcriptional regulator
MNNEELIRHKFAAIRRQAGLSQAHLGAKLHCDQTTISRKETGHVPIYAWELAEFSEITGVEVKSFFE